MAESPPATLRTHMDFAKRHFQDVFTVQKKAEDERALREEAKSVVCTRRELARRSMERSLHESPSPERG
eukprot:CAMPEP_0173434848 /NCGR_PEP_ID=MMETSP1357-20121228/13590_1 /TAXON_ID=77926 /ORGANISM="Hemiselmis rufescens, Strain PCC563" /LENGTH=68 /DNA_ID=CAMNT_0014399761 /DNA_START=83 /DNA_END=285 /DNA_ORIENTATION=-